jgi:arylsulfatase A-like enzyme
MYNPDLPPNIILILTDQHRGDCLGLEHPVVQTPCLDWIGRSGARFTNAYAACPVCIPARRTLMTGRTPAGHGVLGNYETWLRQPTLPQVLRDAGYQTHLCGKLHLWPLRKHYGFDGMDLSDGPGASSQEGDSDYLRFLRRESVGGRMPQMAHGVAGEGCFVRPWHMEERFHVANWAVDCAIDFLERRDRTRPFFLNLSFFHPHPPLTPPRVYYERYMAMDLPAPSVGDWARVFQGPQKGLHPASPRNCLDPAATRQYLAAYYAQVNHIDDQIQRLFNAMAMIRGVSLANTVVIYGSDHGEMLGDHQWHRKSVPYQGAIRIPLLVKLPASTGIDEGQAVDAPVELMDIMPTILDAAGVAIPDTVQGSSLLPLLRGDTNWRPYVHGEIHQVPTVLSGMHYLTDGRRKYVWYPGLGREEYFDLQSDPQELHELSGEAGLAAEIQKWRQRLIETVAGRPEGFTDGQSLLHLNGPTHIHLPGMERDTHEFNEGVLNA